MHRVIDRQWIDGKIDRDRWLDRQTEKPSEQKRAIYLLHAVSNDKPVQIEATRFVTFYIAKQSYTSKMIENSWQTNHHLMFTHFPAVL